MVVTEWKDPAHFKRCHGKRGDSAYSPSMLGTIGMERV
jgi:hypothetical protein